MKNFQTQNTEPRDLGGQTQFTVHCVRELGKRRFPVNSGRKLSTLSEANTKRTFEFYRSLYFAILYRLKKSVPHKLKKVIRVLDATTVTFWKVVSSGQNSERRSTALRCMSCMMNLTICREI